MNIETAAKLLNIQDISNIDKDKLKETYRKMMKTHHPDNNGNENYASSITRAYSVVREFNNKLEAVRNSSSNHKTIYILTLSELKELLDGNEIIKDKSGKEVILSRESINKDNIILVIDVFIMVNGSKLDYTIMRKVDQLSRYSIECNIPVDRLEDTLDIVVGIGDKMIPTEMKLTTKTVKVSVGGNIDIDIKIKKTIPIED